MSDALYVKVGDSVEALDLGTGGGGTAPEYVERIEALESGLETVSTEALGVKADTVLAAETAADVSGGSLGTVDLNEVLSAYEATNAKADAALTELAGGVVKSVNSTTPDADGNVEVVIGGAAQADAYIIETWRSGTSWYRKWSDGWIEQGGYVSTSYTSHTSITVSLHTPFSTTSYFVKKTSISTSSSGMTMAVVSTNSHNTTSFKTYAHSYAQSFYWSACGY